MTAPVKTLARTSVNAQLPTGARVKVLVVDVGGTNVKILASGQRERRNFPSGRTLTPAAMVEGVKKLAEDWTYDVVSLGYPGNVYAGHAVSEPRNLAGGWTRFDFDAAFGCPVKLINDAEMQALGSYRRGTMLFLGLGTGLGSALVVNGTVVPMRLGELALGKRTWEDYVGRRGLERDGRKRWRKYVERMATRLLSGLLLDDIVLGGGNAKELKRLPPGCRLGDNRDAFAGGFLLWGAAQTQDLGDTARAPQPGATNEKRARLAQRAR
jgi:polyphosphate glucokinase